MTGALSTYAVSNLLNLTLRGDAYTSPAAVYLGWFTTPPSADGTATELTGGSYARQTITFDAPTGGTITQDATATFAPLHTSDQMLAGFGIFDAPTAGNLLAYGRTPAYLVRGGATFTVDNLTIASNSAAMSDHLANAWLNHLLNNTAYTPPANTYLGHYTTTPTATTSGTEVAAPGYDRLTATWTESLDATTTLTDTVSWLPLTTSGNQTLTGWALSDANTTGNVLWFQPWATPTDYTAGDSVEMTAEAVTLRVL